MTLNFTSLFKSTVVSFGIFLSSITTVFAAPELSQEPGAEESRYKILHIMSYHSPWRWTDDQFEGFKDGLGVQGVEFKVFQMDTKHNSTEAAKIAKATEARELIKQWQPDLVYTTDDDAQQYVTRHFINSDIPFVFSGVNKSPQSYGFNQSNNITGVVEHEHFVESVKLLQGISPKVKKLAVVFDDAEMWPPIQKRMQAGIKQLSGIELVAWDTIHTFAEFKTKMMDYPNKADAVVLIGIFNFKDENGTNVPYQTVLRWVADHSTLPDISFWVDRVHYGTLATVSVSGREQGLAAGRMARAILVSNKKPRDIPSIATAKGVPVINLARAKALDIKIKSTLLLSAEVIQQFEWDK